MGLKLGGLFKGLAKIGKLGLSVATGGISDKVLSVAKTIGTATGVLRNPLKARTLVTTAQVAKGQLVQPKVGLADVLRDMGQPVMTRAVAGARTRSRRTQLEGAPYGYTPSGSRRGKPCKHGPTGEGQYPCNRAPRRFDDGTIPAGESSQSGEPPLQRSETPNRSSSRKTLGEKVGDKVISEVVRRVVPSRRRRYYGQPRYPRRPSSPQPSPSPAPGGTPPVTSSPSLRKRALSTLAGTGRIGATLAAPISTLPTAGVLGAAILVGLSSYAATRAILQGIADRKEREAVARNQMAMAYRAARLEAQKQLGRPLTAAEQASMAAEYKRRVTDEFGDFR